MSKGSPEGRYLIETISAAIKETAAPAPPQELNAELFFELAKYHTVSNLVYYAVAGLRDSFPEKVMEAFAKAFRFEVFKSEKQLAQAQQILSGFEAAGIDVLPMKGYTMKQLYPHADMRSMSDIDMLFHEADAQRAQAVMQGLGYDFVYDIANHNVYRKKPVMNIELHKQMIPSMPEAQAYFDHAWERAVLKEGFHHVYLLKPEDEYVYMLAHLAKHYAHSGIGVRAVADVEVFLSHYEQTLDWEETYRVLEEIELREFEKNIRAVVNFWFHGGARSTLLDDMTAYFLANGTHGNYYNLYVKREFDMNSGDESFQKRKRRLIRQRFFPPLQEMQVEFPVLCRAPVLLPAFYVYRWVNRVVCHPKQVASKMRLLRKTNEKKSVYLSDLHKRSGLK